MSAPRPADNLGAEDELARFHRTIDDLERRMADSTDQLARAKDIGSIVADVVGEAKTEDGYVRVEYANDGIRDLVLNPRAMRMPSEDLAAAIKKTIADATVNYRDRVLAAMREAGLVASAEEQQRQVEQAMAGLNDAQRKVTESLRSAADIMTRAKQARPPLP